MLFFCYVFSKVLQRNSLYPSYSFSFESFYNLLNAFFSFKFQQLKMVPLETTQRILKWYCVIPSDPLTSRWERSAHFALTCMTIVCNWIVIGSSVAFCVKYMLTDMINCLYALFQIMAALPMTNAIIATFFLRQRIAGIFGKLSKIYEIGKKYLSLKEIFFLASFQSYDESNMQEIQCISITLSKNRLKKFK